MGVFLAVCCGFCGFGFSIGFILAIVQYFQIRKLHVKLNALRREVGEIEAASKEKLIGNNEKTKTNKNVTDGIKKVTFEGDDKKEREVAGQNSVENVDKTLISLRSDLRLFPKFVENYNTSLKTSRLPVSSDLLPNFIFNKFYSDPPIDPSSLSDVLQLFNSQFLPRLIHWQHPQYFGPNGSGRSVPDMAANLLYPYMNNFSHLKIAGLRCLYSAMKIPTEFKHRLMVESGNEALVHVLLAARIKLNNTNLGRMVVYSRDSDSCMVKSARIVMMRLQKYSTIEQLEQKMKEDIGQGLLPTLIIVRSGDETAISQLSKKYNCWLHMDVSEISLAWLTEQKNPDLNGVDSFFFEMSYVTGLKIVWSRHEWTFPRLTKNYRLNYVKLYMVLSMMGLEEMNKRNVWLEDVAKKMAFVVDSYKQLKILSEPVPTKTGYSFCFQYKIVNNSFINKGLFQTFDMNRSDIFFYTSRLYNFLQNNHKFVFGTAELANQTKAIVVNVGPSDLVGIGQIEEICSELRRLFDEFELKKDEMILVIPTAVDSVSTLLAPCSLMSSLQFELTCSEE